MANIERRAQVVRRSRRRNGNPGAQKGRLQDPTTRVRPKQALPAGLALALGDRAQRVEPARDGREEPLLRPHVGGDRPEQRRLRLVGSIAAARPWMAVSAFHPASSR